MAKKVFHASRNLGLNCPGRRQQMHWRRHRESVTRVEEGRTGIPLHDEVAGDEIESIRSLAEGAEQRGEVGTGDTETWVERCKILSLA